MSGDKPINRPVSELFEYTQEIVSRTPIPRGERVRVSPVSETVTPITDFNNYLNEKCKNPGHSQQMSENLQKMGFTEPSSIQRYAIPHFHEGNVAIHCETGSGKTAAYCLPMIVDILNRPKVQAQGCSSLTPRGLILVPTKELAEQVYDQLRMFMNNLGVRPAKATKDVKQTQPLYVSGHDIIVGTFGKIGAWAKRREIDFGFLQWLILDEADLLMEERYSVGVCFGDALKSLLEYIPDYQSEVRMGLFSATFHRGVKNTVEQLMDQDYTMLMKKGIPRTIRHYWEKIEADAWPDVQHRTKHILAPILRKFDAQRPQEQAVVFSNTKRGCEEIVEELKKESFKGVACISSTHSDEERQATVTKILRREIRFIVSTNLLARGMDFPDVGLVVNIELPLHPDTYVHRVGRTGRAGKSGVCLTIFHPSDQIMMAADENIYHWVDHFNKFQHLSKFYKPKWMYEVLKEEIPADHREQTIFEDEPEEQEEESPCIDESVANGDPNTVGERGHYRRPITHTCSPRHQTSNGHCESESGTTDDSESVQQREKRSVPPTQRKSATRVVQRGPSSVTTTLPLSASSDSRFPQLRENGVRTYQPSLDDRWITARGDKFLKPENIQKHHNADLEVLGKKIYKYRIKFGAHFSKWYTAGIDDVIDSKKNDDVWNPQSYDAGRRQWSLLEQFEAEYIVKEEQEEQACPLANGNRHQRQKYATSWDSSSNNTEAADEPPTINTTTTAGTPSPSPCNPLPPPTSTQTQPQRTTTADERDYSPSASEGFENTPTHSDHSGHPSGGNGWSDHTPTRANTVATVNDSPHRPGATVTSSTTTQQRNAPIPERPRTQKPSPWSLPVPVQEIMLGPTSQTNNANCRIGLRAVLRGAKAPQQANTDIRQRLPPSQQAREVAELCKKVRTKVVSKRDANDHQQALKQRDPSPCCSDSGAQAERSLQADILSDSSDNQQPQNSVIVLSDTHEHESEIRQFERRQRSNNRGRRQHKAVNGPDFDVSLSETITSSSESSVANSLKFKLKRSCSPFSDLSHTDRRCIENEQQFDHFFQETMRHVYKEMICRQFPVDSTEAGEYQYWCALKLKDGLGDNVDDYLGQCDRCKHCNSPSPTAKSTHRRKHAKLSTSARNSNNKKNNDTTPTTATPPHNSNNTTTPTQLITKRTRFELCEPSPPPPVPPPVPNIYGNYLNNTTTDTSASSSGSTANFDEPEFIVGDEVIRFRSHQPSIENCKLVVTELVNEEELRVKCTGCNFSNLLFTQDVTHVLHQGDQVLALREGDNSYHRGIVQYVSGGKVGVMFTKFGADIWAIQRSNVKKTSWHQKFVQSYPSDEDDAYD